MSTNKVRLNDRYSIIIPDKSKINQQYFTKQGWETKRLESIRKHTTNEDDMYYIGAESGEMPALSAMWGANVVMIEPNPKNWENIIGIWRANKLPRAYTFVGFASNTTTGELWNQDTEENVTRFADNPPEEAHGFKELYLEADNYPQYKIDDIVNYGYNPPTQMSIDVEGSEFEVLKGAEQTIDMYKPKIWLSLHPEFLFHQWGLYGREVRNWIIDKGYKEKLIDYEHEVHLYYETV